MATRWHLPLARPITGIAEDATGKGYWLVAADGGVFAYGDAHFYGSLVGTHLNAPVVGIASTNNGHGYWLVAADGGVFSFGDARFLGSLAGQRLDQPIVSIVPTRGNGYRLLARDGGVFTFGDAAFEGSLGGTGLTDAIGLAPTPSGNGYWILRNGGGSYQDCSYPYCRPGRIAGPSVAHFGDARNLQPSFFYPAIRPLEDLDFIHDPVVAIAANPVAQGYVILRTNLAHDGAAGALLRP